VFGQDLFAGFREPRAVLLQASQYDHIAFVHLRAAEPRDVSRAGVVSLLRRGAGRKQNEGKDEEESGHLENPADISGAF